MFLSGDNRKETTKKIRWEIPLKTVSEANSSEHWTKKSKRHKQQQFFIKALFNQCKEQIYLPCFIRLVRISKRDLDDDNLRMALKWIRDEISECLLANEVKTYVTKSGKVVALKGRLDDDKRLTWEYSQEKGKPGIRIEIDY